MNEIYQRITNWEHRARAYRRRPRIERYREYYLYYTGEIFDREASMQPISANYIELICNTHASYLWGQWEPQGTLVTWSVRSRRRGESVKDAEVIIDWLSSLFDEYGDVLFDAGLDQSIYGDAVIIPYWDEDLQRVVPGTTPPETFYARWSSNNVNDVIEAIISYPITTLEAEEQYGYRPSKISSWKSSISGMTGTLTYWEHWTKTHCTRYINADVIDEFEHDSPGVVPIVHAPNIRLDGEFYGRSDIDSVLRLQDEMNRRIADLGDIVAYASHPIILLKNYYGKTSNLPVGPDAIWDLGREGEAEYLGMDGKLPVDVNQYIESIQRMIEDLSAVPPVAYGRGDQTNRSGVALAMAMAPLVNLVNRKRMTWHKALMRYVHIAAMICERRGALPFDRELLTKDVAIMPQFAPILPKDRASIVLENVSLVSNGLRTIERALADLGERNPTQEAKMIFEELERKIEMGIMRSMRPPQSANLQIGGKNQPGVGGSPDIGAQLRDEAGIRESE